MRQISCIFVLAVASVLSAGDHVVHASDLTTQIEQITNGPLCHFFGYIGHVRTIPWNASGRYIVGLQTSFQERMPLAGEAADIVLIDTHDQFAIRVIDQTRAWNFQQGTMLCWNPQAPETQFFFNDRDPQTHQVFCVLFDVSQGRGGERIAEFRFPETPFGNSGVAQGGGWFLGINYGRLARLRPVTGYPGAFDWTTGDPHPADDGIFKVNSQTSQKQLLVSFQQLAEALRSQHAGADAQELFINHTLWSRDDSRLYFFVRADFGRHDERHLDVPFVMNADGTNLHPLARHIGGHPEWESGQTMIGQRDNEQILFDVELQVVTGTLGTPEIFPKPNGDVALSPDGKWFVNGHGEKGMNYYTILRRTDGSWMRTAGVDQGGFISGDLRIDPSPCWNRDGSQILVTGIAEDEQRTRQMFVITIHPTGPDAN